MNKANDRLVSLPTYIGLSFGVFSAGIFAGIQRIMKKHNSSFRHVADDKKSFGIALKALQVSTLYTVGTFSGVIAIFVIVTGITSFHEVGYNSRLWFERYGLSSQRNQSHEVKEEIQKVGKMDDEAEINYWYNYFSKVGDDSKGSTGSS